MATTIKIKNSVSASEAPISLEQGEFAVNITDKKLWVGNSTSTPVLIADNATLQSPLAVGGNSTAGAEIRLPEDTDNGSNYVALKAANSIASNITFTLPNVDGTNGQYIKTNGSGTLSFGTVTNGEPVSDTYTSGTAATWTKPADANWVQIEIWGGGASGARSNNTSWSSGGGGGGAYQSFVVKFDDLQGTVTYTVGAGGASRTTGSQSGATGGTSSVTLGSYAGGSDKTLYAYGGSGGSAATTGAYGGGGGSGGGNYADGDSASDTGVGNGAGYGVYGGGLGGTVNVPGRSYYGGSAGGRGGGNSSGNAVAGADCYYGGAGGGGSGDVGNNYTPSAGGSSVFGGNGGAGNRSTDNATAGTAPAGGGGGSNTGNSGAGGAGQVRFTYW